MLEHRCTIMPNMGPENGIVSKGFQVQLIAVVQSTLSESQWGRELGDSLQISLRGLKIYVPSALVL